jgi:hypothetical protein
VHDRPLGDVLGEVGASFQFGQDEQEPDKAPQAFAGELRGVELRPDEELDFGREFVYDPVTVNDGLAGVGLALKEGLCSRGQRF